MKNNIKMKDKSTVIIAIIVFAIVLVLANSIFQNNGGSGTVSGAVKSVDSKSFQSEVLNSDKKVLIDFYADWCGPCKMLSPIVEEVASENKSVKFVRINTDENNDLANTYGISAIPTLVVIENGKEVNRSVGYVDKSRIEELIK